MKAFPYPELRQQILFFDIGINTETHFRWVNPADLDNYLLDVIAARNFPADLENYIHLQRKENKMVFRQYADPNCGFKKLLFVIGATKECQYQVVEAFLDYLSTRWFEQFGSMQEVSSSGKIYERFNEIVEQAFEVIPKEVLMKVKTHCKLCNQYFGVYLRKSLVEEAPSYPVAIVFQHAHHALLVYVDDKYESRGESIVNITG